MKKLIIIVLHLALVFSLIITIGATTKNTEEKVEKFTGVLEENIVLRVLDNDTAIKQGYFQKLLDGFNEKYKEYNIVAQDANMDQYTDLEKDGPYGLGPDILYQANDRLMSYVNGKHILPIDTEYIDNYELIADTSWKAMQSEVSGSTYTFGIPVNIQAPLLYYRKDLLPTDWKTTWDDNKNDIPDMLESWNSMYKYSLMLKNDGNDDTWGYMRSFMEPYFSTGYLLSYGGYCFGDDNTNSDDIGLSKGESYKGAKVIKQLASLMDERCIDDTVTVTAYSELAKGHFFATITTPDVYTLFETEIQNEYGKDAVTSDYIGVADIPMLPESGDLTEENPTLIPCTMMGGVHCYAISSYTKYPNAALAFLNYATSYEMIVERNNLLGIAPARTDIAAEIGGLSEIINKNITENAICIMPSIKDVGQLWSPLQTLFQGLAKDAFRKTNEVEYTDDQSYITALEKVDKQIYDAIHILQ